MNLVFRRTEYDSHNTYTVFCKGKRVAVVCKFRSNHWMISGPIQIVDNIRYYRQRDVKTSLEKAIFAEML